MQARTMILALALAGASAPLAAQQAMSLEEEAAIAAESLRQKLPMRVDDITTVVGIRADGAEFVYDMRVSEVFEGDHLENARATMQASNQSTMCRGEAGTFIRRGGSMRHIYTDPNGNQFETRVARCPPAQ